ncbi:hypothetical protein [Agrobacterium pusense]|uniref:hypothetical protein n=1 Tax=Agrobacterium pusense TaxID=648995 RepID=UPI002FE27EB5
MISHPIGRVKGKHARAQAYDRRIAAIHEAGHAFMAVWLGLEADAWIYPIQVDDFREERTWLGKVTVGSTTLRRDHPHIRMVAVAGMVAETLWKNGHDEYFLEPHIWERLLTDEDSMSHSDWGLAGCSPGEPDDALYTIAAEVAWLFMCEQWSALTGMSRDLMKYPGEISSFRNDGLAV